MSKILRRPMFRGGPVDSYNTGIASGLGQPRIGAKRGRFFGDVGNPYTAPLLMDTASVLPPIRKGRIRGPKDFEASRAGTISDAEGLFADASETGVNKDGQEFFGNVEFGIEDDIREQAPKLGVGSDFDKDMENYLMNNVEVSPGLEALRKANIRDANKPSMIEDLTTEKVVETEKGGDDDVEVTMTDLEKALGLDKARRRDLGDMLGRASAAFLGAGDVREGLAEFMAAEAKAGPSRTERIKSIAGLEEFKAKKAKELYEAKLKGKTYAPGNAQKNYEFFIKQGIDKDQALNLSMGRARNFDEAFLNLSAKGTVTAKLFDTLARQEGIDPLPQVDIETLEVGETFYLPGQKSLITIVLKEGKKDLIQTPY